MSLSQNGSGTTILSGTNTYTGGTQVNAGKLAVDGSIFGNVAVAAAAQLGGHGSVGGTINGAGAVGPENSQGILTAGGVDPTGGLTFNFEFTQAGAPLWSNSAASGNDVLHLNLPAAFTSALTGANPINLYFAQAGVSYEGGFFTNGSTDNLTANLRNATLSYYVLYNFKTNGVFYNGNYYDPFTGQVNVSAVQINGANFADGTVNGWTEEFDVNIHDGLLSLAICKPMIRSTADVGDILVGFAGVTLHPDSRLIYAARITEPKLTGGDYFRLTTYSHRADCIYEWRGNRFVARRGAIYHGSKEDLERDIGFFPSYDRANTLLSRDFCYFGVNGSDAYKSRYPAVASDLSGNGCGCTIQPGRSQRC